MSAGIALQKPAATTLWGVQHSQGINWFGDEASARVAMASALKYEIKQQPQARGKIRLFSRELGPIVQVENPYDPTPLNSGKDEAA